VEGGRTSDGSGLFCVPRRVSGLEGCRLGAEAERRALTCRKGSGNVGQVSWVGEGEGVLVVEYDGGWVAG
jgi:hypothetical protein